MNHSKEIHSKDQSCWIEGERGAWRVVWKGATHNSYGPPYKTREQARRVIRSLKKTHA